MKRLQNRVGGSRMPGAERQIPEKPEHTEKSSVIAALGR
jgi:hypothetical protein